MAIKPVTKTSEYGIGQMVHVIHMTDDVRKLQAWWEDVFGGFSYMGIDEPNYLPIEDRHACLLMVRDLCIEVMAPAFNEQGEVNSPQLPVGKFYSRFGQHLHSVGYFVDDIVGLGNHMIDNGIYIGKPGGGAVEKMDDPSLMYFYPSPKFTAGLMVEISKHPMPNDPREKEEWSSLAKVTEHHPLTIERFSYVTLGVRDLDEAVKVYVNAFKAIPLEEASTRTSARSTPPCTWVTACCRSPSRSSRPRTWASTSRSTATSSTASVSRCATSTPPRRGWRRRTSRPAARARGCSSSSPTTRSTRRSSCRTRRSRATRSPSDRLTAADPPNARDPGIARALSRRPLGRRGAISRSRPPQCRAPSSCRRRSRSTRRASRPACRCSRRPR